MKKPKNEAAIWQGSDYRGRTVSLYDSEHIHIITEHAIMRDSLSSVYSAVTNPQSVYQSDQSDTREVMFGAAGEIVASSQLRAKVVVDYNTLEDPRIVTAFPTKKERGGIGDKLYPKSDLRQEE